MDHLQLPISAGVILFLAYGNLRGVREAGRLFALPAYLFMAAVGLILAVSAVRGLTGGLPHADLHAAGVIPVGTPGSGWLYGASLFIVLRAFANGGSSLTGPGGDLQRHLGVPRTAGPQRPAHPRSR